MKYRKIDREARAKTVLADQALSKEREAYSMECHVEHLKNLPETDVSQGSIDDTERQASFLRKRAIGLLKAAKVAPADVKRVQRAFLEEWIESLEGQHVDHESIHDANVATLETKGSNALAEDEVEALQEEQENHEKAMRQLESAHAVAVARLDKLGPEPKQKAADE